MTISRKCTPGRRRAFEIVEHWPQEKVDEMALAAGYEWQKDETAQELARLAVDESGIGVYEDKVAKIQSKTRGSLWDMHDAKTCDVVEEDPERGLVKFAKPMGVIANVVPCTNPESTICALGVSILKTRNAMIVSPHPRTQGSSYLTVEHGRTALAEDRRARRPHAVHQEHEQGEDVRVDERSATSPSPPAAAALVKVVYAAGKPCHTVGAGNVVSIVDETADPAAAAKKIVKSKTANNSASCSSENAVALARDRSTTRCSTPFEAEGGYLCSTEEREKLRRDDVARRDPPQPRRRGQAGAGHRRDGRPRRARRTPGSSW